MPESQKNEPDRKDGLFRGLQDLQIGEEILKAKTSIAFGAPPGSKEVSSSCERRRGF